MARHLLTDVAIRKLTPKAKTFRRSDGGGLYLAVLPSGVRSWQYRFELGGKEGTFTIGKYPRTSLADARVAAEKACKLIEKGEHPTVTKRVEKLTKAADRANTFGRCAEAWVLRESKRTKGNRKKWSPNYVIEVRSSLMNHLSALNGVPMTKITAALVAPLLTKVENDAPQMLEKVRRRLHAVMWYAVEQGIVATNPLPPPRFQGASVQKRNYPAVTDLPGIGEILRNARASDPCKGIARAHLLIVFTGLRVSEAVGAKWDEFDLDGIDVLVIGTHRTRFDPAAGNWRVPRSRMKNKTEVRGDFVVPLPPALLATLREWRKADPADAVYVCPAPRDPDNKHITPEGCEKWMREALKLGGVHSPHSWRSAFKSVCGEAGKDKDVTESQLDHVVGETKTESAYDRAERLDLRRERMIWYESVLLAARDGATVTAFKKRS